MQALDQKFLYVMQFFWYEIIFYVYKSAFC